MDQLHYVVYAPSLDAVFERYNDLMESHDDDRDNDRVPYALVEIVKLKGELRDKIEQMAARRQHSPPQQRPSSAEGARSSSSSQSIVRGRVEKIESRNERIAAVASTISESSNVSFMTLFRSRPPPMGEPHLGPKMAPSETWVVTSQR